MRVRGAAQEGAVYYRLRLRNARQAIANRQPELRCIGMEAFCAWRLAACIVGELAVSCRCVQFHVQMVCSVPMGGGWVAVRGVSRGLYQEGCNYYNRCMGVWVLF
jgi:hypothetical protein